MKKPNKRLDGRPDVFNRSTKDKARKFASVLLENCISAFLIGLAAAIGSHVKKPKKKTRVVDV